MAVPHVAGGKPRRLMLVEPALVGDELRQAWEAWFAEVMDSELAPEPVDGAQISEVLSEVRGETTESA